MLFVGGGSWLQKINLSLIYLKWCILCYEGVAVEIDCALLGLCRAFDGGNFI